MYSKCLRKLFRSVRKVKLALQELVRSRRKKNLPDLVGQIQFAPDFDYKAMRETRHASDRAIELDRYRPRSRDLTTSIEASYHSW